METYATTVYVICDEVLRALEIKDDPQSVMSNAEVMLFALIAAKYFTGNHKMTRYMCKKLRLFPNILSESRINRRIHLIPRFIWHAVFRLLALCFKKETQDKNFAVDSFPVACCQKSRIDKCKIFAERKYMELDIPFNSTIYADGAYNCFELEDILHDEKITLLAKRGSKGKNRTRSSTEERRISSKRQVVETAFSCITDLFPRNIRFRTERGFLLKIFCFILAYSTSFISN